MSIFVENTTNATITYKLSGSALCDRYQFLHFTH